MDRNYLSANCPPRLRGRLPYRDRLLAASIAAHGLLQSLVVRKSACGKFVVVAEQRRLLALPALAERGQVVPDLPLECCIIDRDADGTEIGLAENVVRRPMHPLSIGTQKGPPNRRPKKDPLLGAASAGVVGGRWWCSRADGLWVGGPSERPLGESGAGGPLIHSGGLRQSC